ncbi:hypothetical protein [Rasiella sp. SM2506]|uniref:hypothetical protein n=1 Tax=Rasiella sp. SM2506 TaxID=3423914 RepID=UPI003D794EFD
MKISLLKRTKQNNRYNYTPRYYKGKEDANEYNFANKFEKYYETYNKNDFGSHWRDARHSSRTRSNAGFNKTIVIVALILVFVCLWILDFDLSIFS